MNIEIKYFTELSATQQIYTLFLQKHYTDQERKTIHFEDLQSVFFKQTIAAYFENELVAVVSIFENNAIHFEGKKCLFFGYYECVEIDWIASALLDALQKVTKKKNCDFILGPLNGSTWNNYRFREGSYSDVFFTERYHKAYYSEQFSANGFSQIAHFESRIDRDLTLLDKSKVEKVQMLWSNRNISIRNMNLAYFDGEIAKIHQFCLDAFQHNFLYTPIDFESFKSKYKPVEHLIDSNFVLLAEENGELVGLIFAIPDYYAQNEKRLVVKTIAKKSGRRHAGVTHLLGDELVRRAKEQSYTALIHAFMHVENASAQISKQFSGEIFRQYVLFAKAVEHEE
jgi:L-amino acid N-acyltransferase YncA